MPHSYCTSQDCLAAFTHPERLDGDDSVGCEACKARKPHTKRLQLYRLPRVLVLSLKRFRAQGLGDSLGDWISGAGGGLAGTGRDRVALKDNSPVVLEGEAPLDLSPFCNPEGLRLQSVIGAGAGGGGGGAYCRYQLLSVVHHEGGRSLEHGHYTAVGRSVADGAWYRFNDESVCRVAPPSGTSGTAYLLVLRMSGPASGL